MILAGLSLAQLAAVFGAAAVFATALYILKLRRRAVQVSRGVRVMGPVL